MIRSRNTLTARSLVLVLGTMLFTVSAKVAIAQVGDAVNAVLDELRDHRPADALRDADRLLNEYPREAKLWTIKGVAAKDLGDSKQALAAFDSALHIAPDYIPALEGAVEIAYHTDPAEARELLPRLLRQLPDEPNANGMAAMLDYQDGRWGSAVAHFEKSGAAIDTQESALQAYAVALSRLQRNDDAEVILRRILNQWPDDRQSRYNLAVLQFRRQSHANALEILQPLLNTHDETALSLAASMYEADGNTPQAVATLQSAIQQQPKNPQNYLDFAAISFDHSSFSAGITMLNAGLTQLPNIASLYVARGILYMQSSDVDRAEQDFEKANRLDPSQSFGMEAEGLTQIQRHNLPEAFAKVQQSLKLEPRNAYLNYLAAEIIKEQGATPDSPQAHQSTEYAKRAVALDQRLTAARNLLGALAFQSGDWTLTETQCRAVLQQDPKNQEAVYRLILVLRRKSDKSNEVRALVEKLKQLRADEHSAQVKVDRYKLTIAAPSP